MRIEIFSEDRILSEFSGCANLQQMIIALEKKFSSRHELVCEIRVNGMLLDEGDEVRFAETPIEDIKEVLISVGQLNELLADVKEALLECIPSLQETSLKCSEYFRQGEFERAQNSFSALLEGAQWLVDTTSQVKKAIEGSGGAGLELEAWRNSEKDLSKSLRQILLSFQNRDYALLSDILEYELTTVLDSWLSLLKDQVVEVSQELSQELASETHDVREDDLAPQSEPQVSEESPVVYEANEPVQNSMGRR